MSDPVCIRCEDEYCVRQDHDPELKRIIQDSRALYFKKHRPVWETWALSLLHRFEKVA